MATSPPSPSDEVVEIQQATERERGAEFVSSGVANVSSSPSDYPVGVEVQQTTESEGDAEPVSAMLPKLSDVRQNIGESVDRLLDESRAYKLAVRAAFEQFQLPGPVKELPLSQLLPALQFFIQVC